jgi:hypothetical protein
MELKMNIDTEYVMRKEEINKETIKKFFINEEERRKIRVGEVASIKAGFSKENKLERHFSSPLVVNEISGIYRLIDGNHRFEAMRQKIASDPDFKICVWLEVYRNLSREDERKVYHITNRGTSESATDFLRHYWKTIILGDKILQELPVAIYASEKKLAVKLVVGAYLCSKKAKFTGGYGAGGEKTVNDMQEMTLDDLKIIKAWYRDYSEVFGEYLKGIPWYNSTPLTALFKIWYDNKSDIPRDKMINAFRDCFQARTAIYLPNIKSGGREACFFFYNVALQALGNYRKKLVWKGNTLSQEEVSEDD